MGSFRSRVPLFFFFASALCSADSGLLFNKTFGGAGNDYVSAIATDASGFVFAGGTTSSYDFPVTNGSRNTATHFAGTPDSGGSWQPLGNLPSGTPLSLAVDASTPPVWYAGGNGGIFKSSDGGVTWDTSLPLPGPLCNTFDPACGARSLVVHPTQPSTIYAIVSGQIVKSADAGATWSATSKPLAGRNNAVYLALDPFHPDHVFAGYGFSHYRSTDGGQTWTPYTTPAPHPGNSCGGLTPVVFDLVTPNLAYVQDHCDLMRSTDGGVSWSYLPGPFNLAFAVLAAKSGVVFLSGTAGLYASGDQGVTWTLILPGDGYVLRPIAIDPAQTSVIITGTLRSVDGGATWTPLALGRDASAIVFDPANPGRAIAATVGAATGFLAKLNSAGDIFAATYVGGQGGASVGSVVTDAAGNIYVSGSTLSRDFPVTPGAFVTAPPPPGNGNYYFVASFDTDLNPRYATYLPVSPGFVNGIAVDALGSVAVSGIGPAAPGAQWTCFVTRLKPDGSGAVYSTRLATQGCSAIASDAAGNTVVAGTVTRPPGRDASVTKLDPGGNVLYSGTLGGKDDDVASAVALDAAGNIYVAGNTASKDFPTTAGAYQTSLSSKCPYPSSSVNTGLIGTITNNSTDDAFITKLDSAGNPIYSTYLGGGCYDVPRSMAVDQQGNVWITGTTDSDPFPQVSPVESGPQYTYYKAFVSELDAGGASLTFSSYITAGTQPSIAVDAFGNAYIGGSTTTPQSPYGGLPAPPPIVTGVHASLAKVQPQSPAPIAINSAGNAFTLRSGPVSPGQITQLSVDGLAPAHPQDLTLTPSAALPRSLAGTQVLFDGQPAPIVSVASGRVAAIAPYSLAGKQTTSVQVIFQGTMSAPVIADVTADRGYLSLDGSGTGQVYARNPDGSLNSVDNPVPRGSLLTVYVTGAGAVDPSCPEDGVATTATLVAAGLTTVPGAVCGLLQTNIQAPTFGPVPNMSLLNTGLTYAVK